MSQSHHDSPYRDAPTHAPASHDASRSARRPSPSRSASAHLAREHRHGGQAGSVGTARKHQKSDNARRRSSRRSRRGSPYASTPQLTSHPTSRAAYVETRQWLLAQHGPVCAYCGDRFSASVMTLDHVAPRRGRTAYDRRDNLVLACPACNAAKRDQAPMAFLLARRSRAAHLLRYGTHLSPLLVEMARSLAPAGNVDETPGRSLDLPEFDDDESPYRD